MNKPTDPHQLRLTDILESCGLVNHIHFPTHKDGNTLDLIITRDNGELDISNASSGYFISDHCFVIAKLNTPRPDLSIKAISYRKTRDIDMPAFKSDLAQICEDLLPISDIEVLAYEYNKKLNECLDRHAPVLTDTFVARPKVKWYSNELRDLKRKRRKFENTWRRTKLLSDDVLFKQAKNYYVSRLNHAHVDHYQTEIAGAHGNQKKLFSIIQQLASVHHENPLPDHDSLQELADRFGDFFIHKIDRILAEIDTQPCSFQSQHYEQPSNTFSAFKPLSESEVKKLVMDSKSTTCDLDPLPTPLLKDCIEVILPVLTKMVNLSLQSGVFPTEWKLALVFPLIKKFGLETICNNYRPVSNLPFVSKLVERAALHQDGGHIQTNCPLPVCASAYREGHSTESALLKVQADILHNMELQQVTLLVLIDLSAAFNTIDHAILLDRLENNSVSLAWPYSGTSHTSPNGNNV